MNSVGIDISKGRSTVAVMRPFGEVVISPFEVRHTAAEELLPPVPAVFQGADGSEEQFDLAAGYGVSKRQPSVFKPDPWGRE